MSRIERILVTPRWSGTTHSDWYPWAVEQLGPRLLERVALPARDAPTIAGCVAALQAWLAGADRANHADKAG